MADGAVRPRSPIFYGWWIVLASMAIELVSGGLFVHAYGGYLVLLRSEFGWSATLLSMGFALVRVEYGILGPLQGWLVDRYGPRRVVTVGIVVLAIGFFLFSHVADIETFFASIFIMAVGVTFGGFSATSVALVNWFERRRSTALGLLSVGSQGGPALLPLVALSFGLLGWRATALLSALAVLLIGLPAAQVLRHRPGPSDVRADGRTPGPALGTTSAASGSARPRGFTVREALRARQFWYLSLGHACALLVVSAVLVHLIPHLINSLAFTLAEASGFVVLLSVVTVAGSLVGGAAGDRIRRESLLVTCMSGHAIGIIVLGYATSGWMVVISLLLHGLAWGVRGPLMTSIRADYFGLAAFGTISGMSHLVLMIGMIGGPVVAGLAFDLTGSYAVGFALIGMIAAMGAAFFVLASRSASSAAFARSVGQQTRET